LVQTGVQHNIINTSKTDYRKFYTNYSPPHHKNGIIRATKEEAEANEAEFNGMTTE
jgi:hypothetical protein